MLSDKEAVHVIWSHVAGHFPKVCASCGQRYASLKEYLEATSHVGPPISYDEEMGYKVPKEGYGTVSLANCPCGTTISISSRGIGLGNMWRLLRWARAKSKERRISVTRVLEEVRQEIDRRALAGEKPEAE